MTKEQQQEPGIVDLSEYITPNEAGQIVGVTGRRIRQLLSDGTLEGKRVLGRWLVNRESLYNYLAENSE